MIVRVGVHAVRTDGRVLMQLYVMVEARSDWSDFVCAFPHLFPTRVMTPDFRS